MRQATRKVTSISYLTSPRVSQPSATNTRFGKNCRYSFICAKRSAMVKEPRESFSKSRTYSHSSHCGRSTLYLKISRARKQGGASVRQKTNHCITRDFDFISGVFTSREKSAKYSAL